jgi:carbonic anhydrase
MTQLNDKPQNGLAGLKHWRHDLLAGFLVAMISTPFSIGIAVASGAPPITGLTSAIIAGLIMPFLGGSFVTISGPAAGLAPVLYSAMLALGAGNLQAGYPLLLPVIMLAGVIQLGLSKVKAARYSAVFPVPVVEGMLAAIGLLIMVKQLPTLLGHPFVAHSFWGMLWEFPRALFLANTTVLALGLGTLALMVSLTAVGRHNKLVQWVSPQLIAVAIGTLIANVFCHIGPNYLIHIPANPLVHGITLPDFRGLLSNAQLWTTAITIAITLTLIDGIESLATINAIDKIDPYHRQSDPDKTLFAIGVANIASSLAGGLTIIPGGVKSTANIMAGGRTQWANFYNACFLLLFLLCFNQQISTLPLAVLSAVLVFTGYKLCKPQVWQAVFRSGWEQLVLFAFTIVLTLSTDLMWGIIGGVALAFSINAAMLWQANRTKRGTGKTRLYWALLGDMLKTPVTLTTVKDGCYTLHLTRPLVCFNYLYLLQEFKKIPAEAKTVVLHISPQVLMIDHTVMDNLAHWMLQDQAKHARTVELLGLDQMRQVAPSQYSTHMQLDGAGDATEATDKAVVLV